MMLNCKEVSESISSERFRDAGWRHRLAVHVHIFLCRKCRRYKAQIEAIGAAVRQLVKREDDSATVGRLTEQILKGVGDPDDG